MVTFSANLGFLWNDLPLPDAIRAAAAAGFDAVECHWPYDSPIADTKAALAETGLAMLGINTRKGDDGEFGLAAVPGRTDEARLFIDEALSYAHALGVDSVHVMAGVTDPMPNAFLTYLGYYLNNMTDAAGVIDAVDRPNLKLMFDCYHAQITEGDVLAILLDLLPVTGHVQFASVPGRNEPDRGVLDYQAVFALLDQHGWDRPLGAEYRPAGDIGSGLSWLQDFRN